MQRAQKVGSGAAGIQARRRAAAGKGWMDGGGRTKQGGGVGVGGRGAKSRAGAVKGWHRAGRGEDGKE